MGCRCRCLQKKTQKKKHNQHQRRARARTPGSSNYSKPHTNMVAAPVTTTLKHQIHRKYPTLLYHHQLTQMGPSLRDAP